MDYDVAIIGGGPAGSTAATLLAKKGRKVLVLEREKFPRFHIGESLLPYSMEAFERLGVREQLDAMCLTKIGARISTACGKNTTFYFKNGFRLKHRRSYNVLRSDFDKLLLDNAAACGAEVREETTVERVSFDDDGVTLEIAAKSSGPQGVRAKYVIDASGRNTVIGQQLQLKKPYPTLQKFSCFAHYDRVASDGETEGTLVRLIRGLDRWFWMIPVSATRTSVGVVMDTKLFKTLKQSPEEMLDESMRAQPVVFEQMQDAVRATPVYSTGDYSYRNSRLTGDRWLLAGDAAGFIDPIFSTGVFIAVLSGEKAADALDIVLTAPERRAKLFAAYERRLHRVMDMYLRFVNGWYEHSFIEVFASPTEHLQLAGAVNAILAGNVGNSFSIWWRMRIFYLVLFLQRRFPLVPRLTLKPEGQAV